MISIKPDQIKQLKGQIKKHFPIVSCGAVIGQIFHGKDEIVNYSVRYLMQLENESFEKKESTYVISAEQYIKAEDFAFNNNLQLLGFYYSGTKEISTPSEYDLKYSIPGIIYINVLVSGDKISFLPWEVSQDRNRFKTTEVMISDLKEDFHEHQMAVAI